MTKKIRPSDRLSDIDKAKINSKVRSAQEVIGLLRHYSGKKLFAIYQYDGGYLFINDKDGIRLYDHAMEQGHVDPDFLGFYGRFGGWKYFAEDIGMAGVAA